MRYTWRGQWQMLSSNHWTQVDIGIWMTLDDLDTWRVIYSICLGAYMKSSIHFGLYGDPQAQDSYEVRIAITERSLENGPYFFFSPRRAGGWEIWPSPYHFFENTSQNGRGHHIETCYSLSYINLISPLKITSKYNHYLLSELRFNDVSYAIFTSFLSRNGRVFKKRIKRFSGKTHKIGVQVVKIKSLQHSYPGFSFFLYFSP